MPTLITRMFLDGSEIEYEEGLVMLPDAMSDDVETVRSVATAAVAANTTVAMIAIDDDDAGTESACADHSKRLHLWFEPYVLPINEQQ
jgi:hypothetical protein